MKNRLCIKKAKGSQKTVRWDSFLPQPTAALQQEVSHWFIKYEDFKSCRHLHKMITTEALELKERKDLKKKKKRQTEAFLGSYGFVLWDVLPLRCGHNLLFSLSLALLSAAAVCLPVPEAVFEHTVHLYSSQG